MKLLLIQPPNSQLISRIPLGLLSIGSYLKKYSCHDVTILDLASYLRSGDILVDENVYSNCANFIIDNYHADVYAFSTVVTNEIPALQIAKCIKMNEPNSIICLGNQWATLNDVEIIQNFDFVDVIIRGEGEVVTKQLMDRWSNRLPIDTIPGITYRSNGAVKRNHDQMLIQNLDVIPSYDFNLLNPHYSYYSPSEFGGHYGILEFGRGCPYSCSFCSTTLFWRRKVRRFSVSRTISDIKMLVKMGFDFIEFTYDNFGTIREEVLELCNIIIESKLDIHWSIRCRLDYLDEELINKLKQAKCAAILVGVESGSTKVLNKVEKKINFATIFKNIDLLVEAGIRVDASFVTGLPYETREDVMNTIKLASLIKSYGKQAAIEIHFVTPLPGTRFTTEAIEKKALAFSDDPNISPDFSKYLSWPMLFNCNESVSANHYRLNQDQELINCYPSLFTAYGYIQNPHISPAFFSAVSTFVNVLIQFYPMTIFFLCDFLSHREQSFIEDFQLYCIRKGYSSDNLLKVKIEVEAAIESCCRKDTQELLHLFAQFLEEIIPRESVLFDYFKYEKLVVEMAEDRDFIDHCFTNIQIDNVRDDLSINSKCRVIELRYDILQLMKSLQNECIQKGQDNIQNWIDNCKKSPTSYLLLPIQESKRYFSGLEIRRISKDIYSIFTLMDGKQTIKNISQVIKKKNCEYYREICKFLNANKEIWYQSL